MLVGTLGGSLIGNILAGKGGTAKRQSQWINRLEKNCQIRLWKQKGQEIVRAGHGNKMDF